MADPPVVALIGPTGSGKSAVAMAAARRTGAAIVAVDAFTVYRGMDIGTAKPSSADRTEVPHHMVDVLDVEQDCTVAWFQAEARRAVDACRTAGTPVLLVGGSGLYFRAVVDPLQFPPTDPDVRARIAARVEPAPAAAHAQLAAIDPSAAARIDPGNARRITRALEVTELTGRLFSSFATDWRSFEPHYRGLQVIGLDIDRPSLTERIASRTRTMIDAGWVEECRVLRARDLSATAMQAIGYAELFAYLSDVDAPTSDAPTSDVPPDDVVEAIDVRTRRFATRQQRWFAGDPRVQWTAASDAASLVTAALEDRTTDTIEEDDDA